uniref:Uncharacterized protein n=1 Tax=Stegastes partitus TaxID=144197 RepID=A0A3B5B7D6_9TELE
SSLSTRSYFVIFPVRTDTSSSVDSLMHFYLNGVMKREQRTRVNMFCLTVFFSLCTEQRQKDREDCLFQRVWFDLADQHDLFYSTGGNRLLRLVGSQSHWEPPEPSSALTKRRPSTRRQRRSEEVNPSDPLRSESHPPHSAKDPKDADHSQPEQDRAGAVSKETITSCDDPLRVLQSKGAVSPVKANIADRADQD